MFWCDTVRIGIVGSRKRDSAADKEATRKVLLELLGELNANIKVVIVSGGCVVYDRKLRKRVPCGGDRFAEEFAEEYGWEKEIFLPKWEDVDPEKYQRFEAARVLLERNTPIAVTSDYLIAVVTEDRTGGTEDTVRKFKKHKGRHSDDRLRLVPQI